MSLGLKFSQNKFQFKSTFFLNQFLSQYQILNRGQRAQRPNKTRKQKPFATLILAPVLSSVLFHPFMQKRGLLCIWKIFLAVKHCSMQLENMSWDDLMGEWS